MPSIAIPVSLRGQLLNSVRAVTAFSPSTLFALNEPGVWYDPSDVANLAWRRNLLTWTEQFENAAWTKSNTTVTANAAIAPDGTTTADKVIENASTSVFSVGQTGIAVVANSSLTLTVRAKPDGRSLIVARIDDGSNGAGKVFDLSSGTTGNTVSVGSGVSLSSSSIGSLDAQGYRLCRITVAFSSATTANARIDLRTTDSTSWTQSYAGNGTSGALLWGAQLELGSVATDYQRISDVNTEVIERFPSATLYQDTAGTTPVTTPGQTVALALDKSKGLVLGSELVTNGDFSNGTTGWTVGTNWSVGSGAASKSAGASGNLTQAAGIVSGRFYKVSFDLTISGGNLWVNLGANDAFSNVQTTSGRKEFFTTATGANGNLQFQGATNVVVTVDNISVKELPGFHATQATLASRPTYGIVPLGGRRNLLTYSEQFDNAAWVKTRSSITANAGIAPDGTTTADKLVEDSTPTNTHVTLQAPSGIVAGAYTATVYAKSAERSRVVISNEETSGSNGVFAVFNLGTGAIDVAATAFGTGFSGAAATITSVGSGWYRCSVSGTTSATTRRISINLDNATSGAISQTYTGNGTSGILIWGAQLETGSSATAYQRVGSAFDVTEAGVASLSYLSFDGVDDFLVTPTITPGIDKAQVFAGVRKLSDANIGVMIESSALVTNAGTFSVYAPNTAGTYASLVNGSALGGINYTTFTAPITNVISNLYDISQATVASEITFRANGAVVSGSSFGAASAGTGNFLAYPMYIGRRAGTTLPFNGQIFSLIVRFGTNLDAGTITSTETWVGGKTGIDIAKWISPTIFARDETAILDRFNATIERRAV